MVPFLNTLTVHWKTTDLLTLDLYVTNVLNMSKRKRVEKDFWEVSAIILVRCLENKIIIYVDSKNKILCSSQQKFSIFITPRSEFPSTWGQLSTEKIYHNTHRFFPIRIYWYWVLINLSKVLIRPRSSIQIFLQNSNKIIGK